jgi:hypothetical protein
MVSKVRAVIIAAIPLAICGLCLLSRPSVSFGQSGGGDPVVNYKYFQDPYGRPWCGGTECFSGLCCQIKPVQIQSDEYGTVESLGG